MNTEKKTPVEVMSFENFFALTMFGLIYMFAVLQMYAVTKNILHEHGFWSEQMTAALLFDGVLIALPSLVCILYVLKRVGPTPTNPDNDHNQ